MQLRFIRKKQVESTNTLLLKLAEEGAAEGTVIIAETQTAGRGKYGRRWLSDSGNLFFSLLLRPECPLLAASQLTFVTSLGVLKGIRPFLRPEIKAVLKWPNDLLIEGKKVCGILLEALGEGEVCQGIVIGVGVNVATVPTLEECEVTALQHYCVEHMTKRRVFTSILRHVMSYYVTWRRLGFQPIREEWLKGALPLGAPVTLLQQHEKVQGTFEGIDEYGFLLLQQNTGRRLKVSTGDMFLA